MCVCVCVCVCLSLSLSLTLSLFLYLYLFLPSFLPSFPPCFLLSSRLHDSCTACMLQILSHVKALPKQEPSKIDDARLVLRCVEAQLLNQQVDKD